MTYYTASRFLHIGIRPPALPFGINQAIEGYLNNLPTVDWFRYAAQNYVVWTDRPALELLNGLKQIPALKNASFFISVFSPSPGSYAGLMPKEFWDWFNRPRQPRTPNPFGL